MIDPYTAIVLSLAAGRTAYAISADEIFRPVREAVYRSSPPLDDADRDGKPYRLNSDGSVEQPGWLGTLISCYYCTSFWIALVLVAAYWLWGGVVVDIAFVLAVWAMATLFGRVIG